MQSQPIGTMDALFLDLEQPGALSIVASLSIHDPSTAPGGFVRHRDILSYIETRHHLAPQWRQKLIFNPLGLEEPRLVDDPDFDLEFHIRHIGLPNPHDERQLKILVARLFSRPMDENHPLWELYVIEGLDQCESFPPNSFAILLKLHHAVFDGAAALAAMASLFPQTQDAPSFALTRPRKPQPQPLPKLFNWMTGSTTHYFRRLAGTIKALPAVSKSAWAEGRAIVAKARAESKKTNLPVTRFQVNVTSHRVFDWLRLPIDRFEATRHGLGKPKVNDFMTAIIGGGLRRYLASHGELPAETLVTLCPINIRPKNATEVVGNQVAFMTLPLGTATADPIARIKLIADVSAAKKEHVTQTGGTLAVDVLGMVPYPVRSYVMKSMMKLVSDGKMKVPVNATLTNVPQPPGEFYFAGARMVTRVGLAPLFNQIGLTNVVSTSSFEALIAATSCREIMPDIAHYIECLKESFEEMETLALAHAKSAAPSPKAKAKLTKPRTPVRSVASPPKAKVNKTRK